MLSGKMFENRKKSNGISGSMTQEREADQSDLYSQVMKLIEYDEGVPFQFIYDKLTREGFYSFIGNDIKKLLGTDTEVITQEAFSAMIEEIIPLSDKLPADIHTLRNDMINRKISYCRFEMKISTISGEKKWIRETSVPMKSHSGEITGIIGILREAGERHRVPQVEVREEDENDRIKDAFLQNISHEVRTPLNAIVGFSALLSETEEDYNKQREFASLINNSTDHFLEIMDNILEISRINAGSITKIQSEVKPGIVIKRIARNFSQKARDKKLKLECKIPGDISDVILLTDGYKLTQILNNLVGNAIKFTFSGKIELGCRCIEDAVEFYVSDTGIGIKDEHKEKIFEKFYQADSGITRRFQGTGLGLAISKAYVEMLGGKISFKSKTGEGSTFRFSVPIRH